MCKTLAQVNRITDGKFVELGSMLQTFVQQGQDLKQYCTNISEMLSNEDFEKTMQYKLDKLKEIRIFIREIEIDYQWTFEILQSLKTQLRQVVTPMKQINRQLVMLKNLGISTQTCSAHLGVRGREFNSVTEALNEMTDEISENSTALNGLIHSLHHMADSALKELSRLHTTSFLQITDTVDHFTTAIAGFLEMRDEFQQQGSENAANYESFSADIMNIVISLQAQDTFRQSLEHCIDTMKDLLGSNPSGYCKNLKHVIDLQKKQIRGAHNNFSTETKQIARNLQEMGNVARNSVQSAEQMDNIPIQLEKLAVALSSKVEIVSDYSGQMKCMNQTSEQITASVDTMFDAVRNLNAIDTRIRLLGLNSTVKAARIGEGGEALITLSDAIRVCAADISNCGFQISEQLNAVVKRFSTFSESRKDKGHIIKEIKDRLSSKTAIISKLKAKADESMAQLQSCGNQVADELHEAADYIRIAESIDPLIETACDELEKIKQKKNLYRFILRIFTRNKTVERKINKLHQSYTIDSQRETHSDFLRDNKMDAPCEEWSNEGAQTESGDPFADFNNIMDERSDSMTDFNQFRESKAKAKRMATAEPEASLTASPSPEEPSDDNFEFF